MCMLKNNPSIQREKVSVLTDNIMFLMTFIGQLHEIMQPLVRGST